ncbi:hypothetical protein [Sphingomonas sp. M1-B02]|uniref:hypothetical protein n=1 Tax=Sphingomonas sp. M1-B02 TaxID=3114300 RepID=UPI00223F11BB|nr:hypothetical protein [Sphingomonas sp. S6-11]UZK67837.1 hypothetical protein OKW87_08460 [Sphingomonas sp. S6-11]
MLVTLLISACGQAGGSRDQAVRRSGYDRQGRPVPRYILEDPRYTRDPRYWDRNGDFIGDVDTLADDSVERWYRDQAQDEIEHRRFIEYIRDCKNCDPNNLAAARAAVAAKSKK